ncbi:MAG: hypothetical protein RL748_68 [Pseudomonadota bacterium]
MVNSGHPGVPGTYFRVLRHPGLSMKNGLFLLQMATIKFFLAVKKSDLTAHF